MTSQDVPERRAGLTSAEAKKRQAQYGKNELTAQKKKGFFSKVIHIICEPMFLLLLIASVIYFILGEPKDGIVMLVFVVGMISIDIAQEWKTDKTLNVLKDLSAPQVTVIRDGEQKVIASADLVPGDVMLIHEGVKVPADGVVLECHALCADESTLTGEAEGVWKTSEGSAESSGDYWRKDYCYAGTLVTQGTGCVLVDKIGMKTEYGKIGASIAEAPEEQTPLQKQTASIVKVCAVIAAALFVLVGVFTYVDLPGLTVGDRIVQSILSGITLAMATIPEEFPVILTVFLSMGAWRLAKNHSLVRSLPSVETLGEVSVLCVDKTGTITKNQMTVADTWVLNGDREGLIRVMGMGCQMNPYDPMEKAMLQYCGQQGIPKETLFSGRLVKEYPFTDEWKMMGQVWERNGSLLIAAKGSPERILTICEMDQKERRQCENQIRRMSSDGLRVIAVASAAPETEADIPEEITGCSLTLLGLIGLVDPPRDGVKEDIALCNKAGVRVVMITGDNGVTASAVARKIGMKNCENVITGDMLDRMSDEELREKVKTVSIFSRVIPEHKMRIVKAFKENGEIVAMTGDGVNDAAALKYADIGIAMGKRGSEVSREAADLILMDDDFTTIVETVKDGRRIYDNIRKAIGYVFVIHIPIVFSALLAPVFHVAPSALMLLPTQVVLLELMIDPTCSIVLERQPAEPDIMERGPRSPKEKILTAGVLIKSMVQGLAVFAASFGTYYSVLAGNPTNAPLARGMGLAVIILSNLFLVQVNSSDHEYVFRSIARLAKDRVMWGVSIMTVAALLVILYTPLSHFLSLAPPSALQMLQVFVTAFAAVFWYEIVKFVKKHNFDEKGENVTPFRKFRKE